MKNIHPSFPAVIGTSVRPSYVRAYWATSVAAACVALGIPMQPGMTAIGLVPRGIKAIVALFANGTSKVLVDKCAPKNIIAHFAQLVGEQYVAVNGSVFEDRYCADGVAAAHCEHEFKAAKFFRRPSWQAKQAAKLERIREEAEYAAHVEEMAKLEAANAILASPAMATAPAPVAKAIVPLYENGKFFIQSAALDNGMVAVVYSGVDAKGIEFVNEHCIFPASNLPTSVPGVSRANFLSLLKNAGMDITTDQIVTGETPDGYDVLFYYIPSKANAAKGAKGSAA